MQLLWNKIGRSIIAAEKCIEEFGVSLQTPCPTRWNSLYDSLSSFLKHYKSLVTANTVFRSLGIAALTKDDLELLIEYMHCVKPLAAILDIFQREKRVFSWYWRCLAFAYEAKKATEAACFSQCRTVT